MIRPYQHICTWPQVRQQGEQIFCETLLQLLPKLSSSPTVGGAEEVGARRDVRGVLHSRTYSVSASPIVSVSAEQVLPRRVNAYMCFKATAHFL